MPSRESYLAQADQILNQKTFSKEDSSKVSSLLLMADQLDPARGKLRRAQLLEAEMDAGIRNSETRATAEVYERFMRALRFGVDALDALPVHQRAQSVGIDSAGGYLSPAKFSDSLYANMATFDRLFDPNVVDIQQTDTGGTFNWPIIDNSTASATEIAENLPFPENNDPSFDSLAMGKAGTWRADLILVSMELMQDSKFPVDGVLAAAFAIRLARGIGQSFMATLLSEATVGKAAASGQTSSIIYEDIVDMVASVDEVYRQSPKCGWMARQSTVDAIAKLKDSNNRPLRLIEYGLNRVPYLWGYPVYVSPSVPALGPGSPAVGNKALVFGDFNAWKCRRVADGLRVKRHAERFAVNGQVGFTATLRCNGALGKASTAASPITYFQNAAS